MKADQNVLERQKGPAVSSSRNILCPSRPKRRRQQKNQTNHRLMKVDACWAVHEEEFQTLRTRELLGAWRKVSLRKQVQFQTKARDGERTFLQQQKASTDAMTKARRRAARASLRENFMVLLVEIRALRRKQGKMLVGSSAEAAPADPQTQPIASRETSHRTEPPEAIGMT